ncbi:hypothetical protein NM688_g7728 [Phlebia brevispora]|uniref:Uncharacterized protein n=1 Tax=Phlebia brevispora TaxID=194682 RepID=A0ACC1S1S2_9APHY|nr:hypothetical protein NM688_g7728 [Phlebia brevispora]
MTSSFTPTIVYPTARDDDGVVRCFTHELEAKKEKNKNCTHSEEIRCLRCEYYVCSLDLKDPGRCKGLHVIGWGGEPPQQVQQFPTPPSSQEDMPTSGPSQQRRAAMARGESASGSPQKRTRSNSPPSNQNPPSTPSAKRHAGADVRAKTITPSKNLTHNREPREWTKFCKAFRRVVQA